MALAQLLAMLGPDFQFQKPPGLRIPELQQLDDEEASKGFPSLERLPIMPRAAGVPQFQVPSQSVGPILEQLDAMPRQVKDGRRGPVLNQKDWEAFQNSRMSPTPPQQVAGPGPAFLNGIMDVNPQAAPLANKAIPALAQNAAPPISYGSTPEQNQFQPVALPDSFAGVGVRVDAPWRHMEESEQGANARYMANLKAAVEEQQAQAQMAHFGQQGQYQNANLTQHLAAMQQENRLRLEEIGLHKQQLDEVRKRTDWQNTPEGRAKADQEAFAKQQTLQGIAQNIPEIMNQLKIARAARILTPNQQIPGPIGQLGPLLDLVGNEQKPGIPQDIEDALTEMYKREQLQPGLLTSQRMAALSQILPQLYGAEKYQKYIAEPSMWDAIRSLPGYATTKEFWNWEEPPSLLARQYFGKQLRK